MQHNHNDPGSPIDWLRHAHSDLELARARNLSEEILLEELCFHAQQAVEKSLKAILISIKISFPKTHNIRILLDILSKDINLPEEVEKSASLTDYAVTSRYPSAFESIDEKEYEEALQLAAFVLNWAEKIIKKR